MQKWSFLNSSKKNSFPCSFRNSMTLLNSSSTHQNLLPLDSHWTCVWKIKASCPASKSQQNYQNSFVLRVDPLKLITLITINKSLQDLERIFDASASLKHPVDWANGFFRWIGITNLYLEPNIAGAPSMHSLTKESQFQVVLGMMNYIQPHGLSLVNFEVCGTTF